MLRDIALILGMWAYNDMLQINFAFRSGPMIFVRVVALGKVVTTKYLAKFQSPRAITLPKIIGPERNVNLICNSSLYTHIPKIKSISPSLKKKVVTTKYLAKFQSKMIFGRVMALGL
jgi:hypothetical protein